MYGGKGKKHFFVPAQFLPGGRRGDSILQHRPNRTVALVLHAVFMLLSLYQNRQDQKKTVPWRWARLFPFVRFFLALNSKDRRIQPERNSSISGSVIRILADRLRKMPEAGQ
jgi:hypothetical protein